MDPVTHAVIGMSISKFANSGMELTNPVSIGIITGAVFPDIDIIYQKWGDYAYLKNHRGLTHSVPGLLVSAMLITILTAGIYRGFDIMQIFLWSFLGCLSHTVFDMCNSYGAKLLWPITNRKFSFNIITVADPILFALLLGYVTSGVRQGCFLAATLLYLASRALMKFLLGLQLKRAFGETCKKISVLPSMVGSFKWTFVLEKEECNVVGQKYIMKNGIKLIRILEKAKGEQVDKAALSSVGKFFSEFSPLFHILCEKAGGITRYIFIDMRYFVRGDFLHHAVLEVDENERVLKSIFSPYSRNRSIEV